MSTKTSFKRIALVAVASLGFGMLSVAPSQAAGMLADTLVNAADGSATVASTATVGSGTAATAKIVYSAVATGASDTATVTGTITSVPATSGVFATTFAATGGTSPDVNASADVTSGVVTATAAGRVTKYITASFTPDVAGTYVIAIKSAGGSNNQTVTWTVTATGVPAATAAASSIAYKQAIGNVNSVSAFGALNYLMYSQGANNVSAAVATTTWTTEAATTANADGSFTTAITAANAGAIVGSGLVSFSNLVLGGSNTAVAVPMTATISGRGYVRINSPGGDTAFGTTVTETASAGNTAFGAYGKVKAFQVMSDGTTGTATVTISAGGVELGKVSLIFTGAKASLALATGTSTKLSKSHVGASETATVTINGLDASGNILAAGSGITAVTDTDATNLIATAAISGNVVTVTGGSVSGAVTWTVTDGTRTVTFVTNTTKKTAKTVTLAMSPTAPAPGEKVTVTITATDSNGSPVADGSRQLFATGLATNLSVGTSTCTTTGLVTLVAGVATCTFFAPATSGSFTISAKEGSDVDNVIAGGTAATISATVDIVNPAAEVAQAAVDAAAEAIDAANAATDAANAAAEAADAATAAAQDAADAVAALSTQVSEMIDALKKQITALTNLVIKIQKKVKA
jgi:hypothetical protein